MAGSWEEFVAENEGPGLDEARARLRGDDPLAGVREPRRPPPDCGTCGGAADPTAGTYCASCTPAPDLTTLEGALTELAATAQRRDEARHQCDAWIRLFTRLEAAVTHHRKGKLFGIDTSDEIDEALWAARDKVLKAAAGGDLLPATAKPFEYAQSQDLDSLGQIGNAPPDDGLQASTDHRRPNSGAEKLGGRAPSQQELGHDEPLTEP